MPHNRVAPGADTPLLSAEDLRRLSVVLLAIMAVALIAITALT